MKTDFIIKVCGMKEPENICEVEALGVSWLGFICWERSPRAVSTPPAFLPERAKRVGVFVNPTMRFVLQKVEDFRLDYVQLHGQEPTSLCRTLRENLRRFPHPVGIIKAFSVSAPADLDRSAAYETLCDYLLFDTRCPTVGGSGQTFDWSILQHYRGQTPFLLSGGIGPESIPALRAFSHPAWAGIDLNSRFETAPGHKDTALLRTFLNELQTYIHP